MAAKAKSSWGEVFKTSYKADFCQQCGTLLDLPTGKTVSCDHCGFTISSSQLNSFHSTSYKSQKRKEEKEEKKEEEVRATIKETCPKCSTDTAYFRTAQTRGADEGQTIFYECISCNHTWTHNS
eukprot:TRINITY_DN12817_c0_g1_i1.p1 TRINITY_DN12817_c0_g1~~TRINITY_DN12817_c0_g1_i1.p1  ORF type:complete len:124 (-),score=50.10 TRINITY_DN12817_c0_g1_i1:167-538(-)